MDHQPKREHGNTVKYNGIDDGGIPSISTMAHYGYGFGFLEGCFYQWKFSYCRP
ncbi:MAG: hypothetical protein K0Q90_176 [Paenibacillaceae bacterium]|nr:hypothetical protein [Paenibacillaceae bacterium]